MHDDKNKVMRRGLNRSMKAIKVWGPSSAPVISTLVNANLYCFKKAKYPMLHRGSSCNTYRQHKPQGWPETEVFVRQEMPRST